MKFHRFYHRALFYQCTIFTLVLALLIVGVHLYECLQHERQLNEALQSRIDNIVTPNMDCTADENMPNRELIILRKK